MEERTGFKKYDKVFTADLVLLGDLLRIHHRQDEINPLLRLYASYLQIWSIELGGHAYIPTDYIESYDETSGTIYLTETLKTVQEETWDRSPDFIARRQSRRQELSIGQASSIVD